MGLFLFDVCHTMFFTNSLGPTAWFECVQVNQMIGGDGGIASGLLDEFGVVVHDQAEDD